MEASGAGVVFPITRFVEPKLLTSTESKHDPANGATSPSVKTTKLTVA